MSGAAVSATVFGVLGLAIGLAGLRLLATGFYRYADDTRRARRHPWVPGAATVVGAVAGWSLADRPVIVRLTVVGAAGVLIVMAAIDLEVHRLPRVLTWPSYPALALMLAGCSLAGGGWAAYGRAVQAGLAGWLCFYVLHRLSRRGLGRGDVTLAGLLGMLLGWFGWSAALVALYAAFLLAGLVAGALLVTKRATRTSRIAFGPAMIAGALAVLLGQ
ncbi:MAG: A24 family peptidase [Tetrasphaera sp.]